MDSWQAKRTQREDESTLRKEAEAHDEDYRGRYPFDLGRLEFTSEEVLQQNDRAYKRGTYARGWRKRRLFELIDLDSLKGKRVLDVGCGIGQHAVLFAQYGASVSGFDLSSEGIRRANETAEANGVSGLCHFQVASASTMPYPDATFDVVVYNAVIHHVVKYAGVAGETSRVLKPGGRVYFAEGIRDNSLYRVVRNLKARLRPHRDHGDVDLGIDDIHAFFQGYEELHYEQFSLVEKFAAQIGRSYETRLPLRALCFVGKLVDDALLAAVPRLRKYCLEVVGYATKAA